MKHMSLIILRNGIKLKKKRRIKFQFANSTNYYQGKLFVRFRIHGKIQLIKNVNSCVHSTPVNVAWKSNLKSQEIFRVKIQRF